jgi:hypothetical protein
MSIPEPEPASHTVNEYCALEKTSRAQLYRDWNAGKGPRYFYNGNRRRISEEARREHRRQKEAEAAARMSEGVANASM